MNKRHLHKDTFKKAFNIIFWEIYSGFLVIKFLYNNSFY